ncbi:MAG: aldehyde dehydrogenase family protein [Candidatus Fermentibacterota bacterium]
MREFDLEIAGKRMAGLQRRAVLSPWDGRQVGEVSLAGPEEMDAAVEAAVGAGPRMAAMPKSRRIAILHAMAESVGERAEELAGIISDEAGKPIRYARGEVARAAENLMAAAAACRELDREMVPLDVAKAGSGRIGLVRRFPVGPVGAISPFNFPLNLAIHKVAPAIAAGCPVVLKPASRTPMSALVLRQLALDAGLPEAALTVVPAPREVADALVTDGRMKLLSFTGSAEVGWDMKARAGKKRVVLELGGNAACIVGPDADPEQVAPRLVSGCFAYSGQVCISVQRIYVFESLFDRMCDELLRATEKLAAVGDPADPEVMVGPMIDDAGRERTLARIVRARDAGARILCGGEAEGPCVRPTLITGADPDLEVVAEEAFAPLAVIEPVSGWDEAIARAADTRFGLQVGVFTNDLAAVWRCWEEIEVGGVIHGDTPQFRVDHMPYGGVRDSGFGREGPRYAIEEMTEPRLLALRPDWDGKRGRRGE